MMRKESSHSHDDTVMTVGVINDERYSWTHERIGELNIFIRGFFRHENTVYRGKNACERLSALFGNGDAGKVHDLEATRERIVGLRGHFSFIIDAPHSVFACVDKIRSYPVFYFLGSNRMIISNSAVELRTAAGLIEMEPLSRLEFEMAGYVTGGRTLIRELRQLQAGEFLLYDKANKNLEVIRHYRYWGGESPRSDSDLAEALHVATVKTFRDMIETLDGRPVWIPLSGGLDSRLVLAILHELRYDNVATFSYGIPGLWEARQARDVAERLKVKWRYVPYEPRKIKCLFHTIECERYFRFASGYSSVPLLADFYAIWLLREENAIPDDAIFINGQTGDYLTGGHVPLKTREIGEEGVDVDVLIGEIVKKHFSLWTNLKSDENLAMITASILDELGSESGSRLSQRDFARYYELYEWQERQTKYVVNGQRMYEWFEYEWRLPHWSDDLMLFWAGVDWQKKYRQILYKEYLRRYDIAGVFNIPSLPGVQYVPPGIKLVNRLFVLLSAVTGMDDSALQQKYSRYFMTYAPYYPQKSYREYLKDSRWHRSCVSYLAREVLKGL